MNKNQEVVLDGIKDFHRGTEGLEKYGLYSPFNTLSIKLKPSKIEGLNQTKEQVEEEENYKKALKSLKTIEQLEVLQLYIDWVLKDTETIETKESAFKPSSIKKCPVCYSTNGYYVKVQVAGTGKLFVNFNGTLTSNDKLYKDVSHTERKFAYCQSCDRRLFILSDLKKSK